MVPLGVLVDDMYEQDYYSNYVDYNSDPEGILSDEDREWIDQLLRERVPLLNHVHPLTKEHRNENHRR